MTAGYRGGIAVQRQLDPTKRTGSAASPYFITSNSRASPRAEGEGLAVAVALAHIAEGGFPEAVCRIVLAGMVSIGAFERRSLRLARLLAQLPANARSGTEQVNWIALLKAQARITAVAPIDALNALEQLLPDLTSRENALAVSAAVMMIEPTLANPRPEIIEFLMGTLDADPNRVIGLACKLTESLEPPSRKGQARKSLTKLGHFGRGHCQAVALVRVVLKKVLVIGFGGPIVGLRQHLGHHRA